MQYNGAGEIDYLSDLKRKLGQHLFVDILSRQLMVPPMYHRRCAARRATAVLDGGRLRQIHGSGCFSGMTTGIPEGIVIPTSVVHLT